MKMYNAIAVITGGFEKKRPPEELILNKRILRLTATSMLVSMVKKIKNLPTASRGVIPLEGVLLIRIYNCRTNANQAINAMATINIFFPLIVIIIFNLTPR